MSTEVRPIPGFSVLVLGAPGCVKALREVGLFANIVSCGSTADFRALVSTDPSTGQLSPQGAMMQSGTYLGVILSDTLEENDPNLPIRTILQRLSTARKLGNAKVGMCILGVSTLGHDLGHLSPAAYLINDPVKMTTGTLVETLCQMFELPVPAPDMSWWGRPIDVEDPDWEPGPPKPPQSTTAEDILSPALGTSSASSTPAAPSPAPSAEVLDDDIWDSWEEVPSDPAPADVPAVPPKEDPAPDPPPAPSRDGDLDLDALIGLPQASVTEPKPEPAPTPTSTPEPSVPAIPPVDPRPPPIPAAPAAPPEDLDLTSVKAPDMVESEQTDEIIYTESQVSGMMGVKHAGGDLPEIAPMAGRAALGRVIAVTVPKGGAGKSAMSLELSSLLALRLRHINRTVALVDANKAQGDVGMVLGLTGPTILDLYAEVGMREMSAEQVLRQMPVVPGMPENYRVLLAPPNTSQSNIPMVLYKRAIHQLRTVFDYVFVDCPVAEPHRSDDLNDAIFGVLRRDGHDSVLVPLIPDVSMVNNTVDWLDVISSEQYRLTAQHGVDKGMVRWLLNQEDSSTGMTLTEVRSYMHNYDRGFLGSVPADHRWKQARNAHRLMSRTTEAADIQSHLAKVLFHLSRERALDYTTGAAQAAPATSTKKKKGLFRRK